MRTVTGLQKVVAGIGKHGPVIMLTAAVHAGKGLFGQQAMQPVTAGNLFHNLHGQLIMITGNIDNRKDRRHFMLGRRGLVMLCFGKNPDFPELFIQLVHESLDTGLDRAEEVIAELLTL